MQKSDWIKDKQLWVAFLAAPMLWSALYVLDVKHVSLDLVWDVFDVYFMLVVLRPILEEIVFRGLLQGWLLSKQELVAGLWGISYANLLTSSIFAVLHVFSHTWWMALAVIVPSLVFGYFRDRYQGWLLPPITLHCFYNAGYFMLYPPY